MDSAPLQLYEQSPLQEKTDKIRKMAQVLAFGYEPGVWLPGQGHVESFPAKPAREDLDRLVETMSQALERERHVLAVYPEWLAEPARRRIEMARSVLAAPGIVGHPSPLPPLAGGLLAALAAAAAPYFASTGALLAALPRLERELYVLAWLGTVAGLKQPPPTLLQHLVSMSPRVGFAACFAPDHFVKRITKTDRVIPLRKPALPLNVIVAGRDGDVEWVNQEVAAALGGAPVKEIDRTPLASQWWGTSKVIEVVGYPIDIAAVAARGSKGLTLLECRWCGEQFVGDRCPFCRIRPGAQFMEGVA